MFEIALLFFAVNLCGARIAVPYASGHVGSNVGSDLNSLTGSLTNIAGNSDSILISSLDTNRLLDRGTNGGDSNLQQGNILGQTSSTGNLIQGNVLGLGSLTGNLAQQGNILDLTSSTGNLAQQGNILGLNSLTGNLAQQGNILGQTSLTGNLAQQGNVLGPTSSTGNLAQQGNVLELTSLTGNLAQPSFGLGAQLSDVNLNFANSGSSQSGTFLPVGQSLQLGSNTLSDSERIRLSTGPFNLQGTGFNPSAPVEQSIETNFPGIAFVTVTLSTTLTHVHYSESTINVRNEVPTTRFITATETTTHRVYVPGHPQVTTITPVVTETKHVVETVTATTIVPVERTISKAEVHLATQVSTLINYLTSTLTAYTVHLRPSRSTITLHELVSSTSKFVVTRTSTLPFGITRAYN